MFPYILVFGLMSVMVLSGCGKTLEQKDLEQAVSFVQSEKALKTHSALKIETIQEGSGFNQVMKGDTLRVRYRTTFETGQILSENRYDRDLFTFVQGSEDVLRGWNEGVLGMSVEEIRKITMPPEYAYGKKGTAIIPPNVVLFLEIELVEIVSP